MFQSEDVKRVFESIAAVMKENAAMLTALDAAMGDGDLGIYMQQGFEKAFALVCVSDAAPGELLKLAGRCIMEQAPSTLGTLMGLFVVKMGKGLGGDESFGFAKFVEILKAGYDEITRRGKAQLGEKTILDSLHPAIEAMENAVHDEKNAQRGAPGGL